jgi:hypothetical protein
MHHGATAVHFVDPTGEGQRAVQTCVEHAQMLE